MKSDKVQTARRLISSVGDIKSVKTYTYLKSKFKSQSEILLNRVDDKNNEYMEFKEFYLIDSIVESLIKLDYDNLSSLKNLSLEVVEVFLQRAFIFLSIKSQSKFNISDENVELLFRKMCNEDISKSGYTASKIIALTNPNEIRMDAMLDSIARFSTGNRLIKAQAFETFENYARNKYSHSVVTLLDNSISEEDALNTLKSKLKKIKVSFSDLIRYWSGLDPDLSREILYKKLLADKILKMPRQVESFNADNPKTPHD
jgi:hypothetical protein